MSMRISKKPSRFQDETFIPGANNKFTVGRKVDVGHSVEVDDELEFIGDLQKEDRYFIVEEGHQETEGDTESEEEEEWEGEDTESEEEEEWEGEDTESEEEEEWEGEDTESEEEEEKRGYWETHAHPLPKNTYRYNVQDGIWSYCGYVKKIEGEYIVTLGDWLDVCPDNIYNDQEWSGNKVGRLRNVVIPKNRQYEYICGEFVFDKGWRNVQLPMGFLDNEDDE